MRRDSIRHSSRRIRGRTLQTHVGEIRLGEILHCGGHRSRNLHESRHRGSLLHLNQRRGNQRCYGSHHRRRGSRRRHIRDRKPPPQANAVVAVAAFPTPGVEISDGTKMRLVRSTCRRFASCRRSKRAGSDQENGIRRFGQLQPCSWWRSSTSLGYNLAPAPASPAPHWFVKSIPLSRHFWRARYCPRPPVAIGAIVGEGCAGDAEAFHLFRPKQAFGRVSLAGRFRGPFTGMLRAKVRANNTIAENALSQ
jgi:hypothetical protein